MKKNDVGKQVQSRFLEMMYEKRTGAKVQMV